MPELSSSDLSRLLELVRVVEAYDDLASLRSGLLPELRRLIPSDSATYTEVDPLSGEVSWFTDPVEVGEAGDQEAFLRCIDQHPLIDYYRRNGDGTAVQFADFLTRRELHRLELYSDFYRPLDVEHQLAITIPAPGSLLIGITWQRERRAFSERARALLNLLYPHLAGAYRQLEARGRLRQGLSAMDAATRAGGPGVIVLGRNGGIELAVGPVERWLGAYFEASGAAERGRLPEQLASWMQEIETGRAGEGGIGSPAGPLVVTGPGGRLSIHYLAATEPGERDCLLLEERRRGLDPQRLWALGLSSREAEVLACAATGRTNPQIAQELFISPRTVQNHLASICRKLGVSTRTAAVARALGAE